MNRSDTATKQFARATTHLAHALTSGHDGVFGAAATKALRSMVQRQIDINHAVMASVHLMVPTWMVPTWTTGQTPHPNWDGYFEHASMAREMYHL